MSSGRVQLRPLLREALASVRAQPVASVLTVVTVALMCAAAILTTGRTVAAEDAALAQIDAVGTRTIVVTAKPEAGLTTALVDRLDAVDGVEAALAFGPPVDVHNARLISGPPVALRTVYGALGVLNIPADAGASRTNIAYTSPAGAQALGLSDGSGAVMDTNGNTTVVVGGVRVPDYMSSLEPLLVAPTPASRGPSRADEVTSVAVVLVVAKSSAQVAPVETTLRGLLDGVDPTDVTIESSRQFALIRAAVGGELGAYGHSTVLAILGISAVLVAVVLLAVVMMRRKDFGRRRALGAPRSLIVELLQAQVIMLAITGAAIGVSGSLLWLAAKGNATPSVSFVVAVAVAAILTAALAATAPALYAASRDPLHELRVP